MCDESNGEKRCGSGLGEMLAQQVAVSLPCQTIRVEALMDDVISTLVDEVKVNQSLAFDRICGKHLSFGRMVIIGLCEL